MFTLYILLFNKATYEKLAGEKCSKRLHARVCIFLEIICIKCQIVNVTSKYSVKINVDENEMLHEICNVL